MKSHRNWPMPRVILRVSAAAVVAALALAAMACKKTAPTPAPPMPEVVVTEVIQRDVPLYSEWVGTTEGFVNAQIYPKVSGYLLKQDYKDGDLVHAGQLLFQIDDREYKAALDQALGNLARMEAQLKQNQQDLARYTALFKAAVIPKQQFDTQTQTTRATAAQVQAAQAAVESAKLNLDWTRVTSPIEGIAGIAKTQVGDLVSATTLLTTVSQLDPIKVTFPISEREYLHFADRIREHQEKGAAKNEPTLGMVLADGSTYKYPGHFYSRQPADQRPDRDDPKPRRLSQSRQYSAPRFVRQGARGCRRATQRATGPAGGRPLDPGTEPGGSSRSRQQS
jgi:RND family efflux transporter MFP subunit